MKNKFKTNSGITLIALVITVIVLLILAGVTIGLLTGENGILNTVKNAADKYNNAAIDEQNQIDNILNLIGGGVEEEIPLGFIPIYTRSDLEKVGSGEAYQIKGKTYNMLNTEKYVLMNDINLSESVWIPLPSFKGEFNGNSKKVKNMTIDETSSGKNVYIYNEYDENSVLVEVKVDLIGLFSEIGGMLYNLGIENCNVEVNTKNAYVGALAGRLVNNENINYMEPIINQVYTTGKVKSKIGYVGGIIGENSSGNSLKNCYNTTSVETETGYSGGIIGLISHGGLSNTYNVGDVLSLNSKNGSIFGFYHWDTWLESLYWYDATGTVDNIIGFTYSPNANGFEQVKFTDAEMKQKVNFSGFDFDNIWTIDEGIGYPKLKGFN